MKNVAEHKKIFIKKVQPVERDGVKLAKFDDFFKCANYFFLTIGIQAYEDRQKDSKGRTFLKNLAFYLKAINMNAVVSTEFVFTVVAVLTGTHFVEATYAMSYVSFAIVSDFKMFFVWRKKATLTKIVSALKAIFPEQKDSQKEFNMAKHLRQCSFLTLSFSVLYMILIWTYNLMGIVKYVVCGLWLGMQDVEQSLPFIVYMPWDWQNHWSYYPIYASHVIAGYISASAQIAGDLFLMSYAAQLIMHFDYLAKKITRYTCSKECFVKDVEFLKSSIQYHADLLYLCEELNQVFGIPLFLNLISSAFVICFVSFQITIGASPEVMFKLILFFISSTAEVYLLCHISQQLLDVSTSVTNAVYDQPWYWADVRYQKMLILMAQRAQQPAQLKATTFVSVSLDTFSELMQISYKFFTLLSTMFGN